MIHLRPIFNYPTVCAVEFESRFPGHLSSIRLRHQWAHLQILTGGPLSFVLICASLCLFITALLFLLLQCTVLTGLFPPYRLWSVAANLCPKFFLVDPSLIILACEIPIILISNL
jgi:hypothetical protein